MADTKKLREKKGSIKGIAHDYLIRATQQKLNKNRKYKMYEYTNMNMAFRILKSLN